MMAIIHSKHREYPDTVLVRTFHGEVQAEEIIESWKQLYKENRFTENTMGVLNNLEDCELRMNLDGFRKIMTYLKTQEHLIRLKIAVVTNDPKNIIFPALGETKQKPLNIKPFSSSEAAIEWITDDR